MESALYATDLEAAKSFYQSVLGLDLIQYDPARSAIFRCADSVLLIFNPEQTILADKAAPAHGAKGPGHVAFRVDRFEIPDWRGRLIRANIRIEDEVDWSNGARSIYFRDPAGNLLEFVTPELWK